MGNHIKVCEYIGNGQAGLYEHFVPQTNIELQLTMEVRLFGNELSGLDRDQLNEYKVETTTWNLRGDAPKELVDADLVVTSFALSSEDDIHIAVTQLRSLLKDGGFLMVHEPTMLFEIPLLLFGNGHNVRDPDSRSLGPFCSQNAWEKLISAAGFEMVSKKTDGLLSTLFLFRKLDHVNNFAEPSVIEVSDMDNWQWVEEIKDAMHDSQEQDKGHRIWLKATTQKQSGLVGMMKCLRLEPEGERFRCIIDASVGDTPLLLTPDTFKSLSKKDLLMNVYRDGDWGSFRHLQIEEGIGHQTTDTEFAYVKTQKKGNLSSFRWCQSALRHTVSHSDEDALVCSVYYSALNFRDVLYATGRLPQDAIPHDLARLDTILGLGWAGRDPQGRRVFGLVPAMSLATVVHGLRRCIWPCPEKWSMAEASTVPVVYSTAYYALVLRGNMQRGDSVLIHSGAGGVGQAAIAIALSYDCIVFTTCSSQEKKDYLRKRFPQLKEECFANSRDSSFEAHVLKQTKGRGCDLVLNSLAEEKLHASLRCVAKHGTFLEIGKYDLTNHSKMDMGVLLRDITVCGVQVDSLLLKEDRRWRIVYDLVSRGIKDGVVTPIKTNIFDSDDIEQAFRFMSRGTHIGKVVIKIRDEEKESICPAPPTVVRALTRASCSPRKTYIITGGLGGFGVELSYWLFERGCRRLLLTSLSGITTGYQSRMIRILREHWMNVKISSKDVGIKAQANDLVNEALEMGPVGGIFHLAAVLHDGMIENQTPETFKKVCHPKVLGITNLDDVTRKMCADSLDWFVAFSSLASGSGNLGQTNYAFANSFMERLCERRKHDGLPGLAIQWGGIADVGMFIETTGDNDTELAGAIPQPFLSCLETLDLYLCQNKPVVSSWVVAEKRHKENPTEDIVTTVFTILGLEASDATSDSQTLSAFEMDSLKGVEIQQALRHNNGLIMSMKQIRDLTVEELKRISSGDFNTKNKGEAPIAEAHVQRPEAELLGVSIKNILPKTTVVKLSEGPEDCNKPPVFMMCPINGSCEPLRELASHLDGDVYAIQGTPEDPDTCIEDVARFYGRMIKDIEPKGPYHIVGYSYGASTGFELAVQLQETGSPYSLVLLDGGPRAVAAGVNINDAHTKDDAETDSSIILAFVMLFTLANNLEDRRRIFRESNLDGRIQVATEILHAVNPSADPADIATAARKFHHRCLMARQYKAKFKLRNRVTLIKSKVFSERAKSLDEDFSVGRDCIHAVDLHLVEGGHITFIQGKNAREVAEIIQGALDTN